MPRSQAGDAHGSMYEEDTCEEEEEDTCLEARQAMRMVV